MHIRHWALPFVALAAVALMAAAPPSTAPNYSPGVSLQPSAIYDAAGNVITNFGGQPPTAAAGKVTKTSTAIAATTSTTIAAANANRIALGIQCASGGVSVDETGAALTAAGVGNGTLFIPAGTPAYFVPPVTTLTALTAYTATAQTCVVTEYLR